MAKSKMKAKPASHRENDLAALEVFSKVVDKLSGRNVDIKQVAEDAEVSLGTLYNWVAGNVLLPYTRTLFRVSAAVGIKITATHIKGFKVPQRLRVV